MGKNLLANILDYIECMGFDGIRYTGNYRANYTAVTAYR
jgi:hypothetical protein